jgi:hypothetical protein
MVKIILAIVALAVLTGIVLAATGVLRVRNTENTFNIELHKKDLEQKTNEAVEKSKQAGDAILEKTGELPHKAGDKLQGATEGRQTPDPMKPADAKDQPQYEEHAAHH